MTICNLITISFLFEMRYHYAINTDEMRSNSVVITGAKKDAPQIGSVFSKLYDYGLFHH